MTTQQVLRSKAVSSLLPRLLLILGSPLFAASNNPQGMDGPRTVEQLLEAGDYESALGVLKTALKTSESSESDPSRAALVLLEIGDIDFELGRLRDAERAYLLALAQWNKPTPPAVDKSLALIGLGGVYLKNGELSKAERFARLALQTREAALGPKHVDLGGPLQNLAAVYQARHKYQEARDLYGRAIVLLERAGSDHRGIAAARGNLAMLLAAEGDLGRAIEQAKTAVSIWETTPKGKEVQLASALNVLAAVYCRAKRWYEAEAAIRRSQDILAGTLGSGNPNLEPILRTYAQVLLQTGRKRQAKQMIERAGEIARQSASLNVTGYTVDATSFRAR